MLQIPFDSQRFKEILNVNKDSDSTKLYLSTKGLAKFTFDNEDISSIYFITRNEQTNRLIMYKDSEPNGDWGVVHTDNFAVTKR